MGITEIIKEKMNEPMSIFLKNMIMMVNIRIYAFAHSTLH